MKSRRLCYAIYLKFECDIFFHLDKFHLKYFKYTSILTLGNLILTIHDHDRLIEFGQVCYLAPGSNNLE